ncbi:hypothetical protein BS47DRAFT_1323469 [Hydnum rufescens UP504]|uniref:Protein-lysine N-methyltransferase EFM4 n=1 Tax=Hydnum rufescens UP504 TaxID=1448309 RepID=A0A9P6BCN0_9AGAM|nr:hypothetical protein BS47DRAFT_1323469 [Hydnum rufescens UP504]
MDLQPSRLGTKEHWDDVYRKEVQNFEDFGDEGEVWFGEDVAEKMVEWCLEHVPPPSKPFCLDVGTGNGSLLLELAENGYEQTRLMGVDYSEDSIKLARYIASLRHRFSCTFSCADFLGDTLPLTLPSMPPSLPPPESAPSSPEGQWDLLLDKGTYDAMALADRLPDGSILTDKYPTRVNTLLKEGGFFLITSCNFTEEELKEAFSRPSSGLTYHSRVSHPTFSFGGKMGSTVSTVAFCKC